MPVGLGAGTAALIGAGLGAAGGIGKSAVAGAKSERDRKLASATQRYSPWTGLKANPVEEADPFGDIASGVAGGAGLGQKLGELKTPVPATTGVPIPTDDGSGQATNQFNLGVNTKLPRASF